MEKHSNSLQKRRFYTGFSMAGTFRSQDYVLFQNITLAKLKRGDIVVLQNNDSIDEESSFVHRISSSKNHCFFTRGDNNPQNDKDAVTAENLIGKVTHYERNGKIHKAWNGRLGMLRARVLHGRLHVVRAVKFISRKPYRLLKKTGIVAKLWRPEIEIIHFETQDGPLVKYIHKGRTVASCWTDSNRWWFRRPYDFVVGPKLKN